MVFIRSLSHKKQARNFRQGNHGGGRRFTERFLSTMRAIRDQISSSSGPVLNIIKPRCVARLCRISLISFLKQGREDCPLSHVSWSGLRKDAVLSGCIQLQTFHTCGEYCPFW